MSDAGTKLPQPLRSVLREMTARIVQNISPERVVLFGSCARGEMTPDSDIDLLVVTPVTGKRLHVAVQIRKLLRGLGVAKDIVVLTPQQYAAQANVPGTVAYPAAHEGIVLYARSNPQ